jgi:hypothetical protein
MAIELQQLKNFQAQQLKQTNKRTNVKTPANNRIVEWALVEIIVLLTGIRDSLVQIAAKR